MFTRLSCLLIFLSTAVTAEIIIDFFDTLRNDPSLSTSISNTSANNLFTVTDSKGKEYRLAQISGFLPFSNGSVLRDGVENDGFALLLAILHFNNVGLAPFLDSEEISKCNIKLTAEMFDTQFSPINSTRLFTRILQRNNTLQSPIPSAVIGAYRSAVTSPLAILTGVNNIPQISYASTSSDFDVKEQYPFFGRTIMSSVGEAQITIDYFNKVLKATYIGVLFVTDSFGSALQKAFQDAASNVGITTDSFAFSFSDADGLEIQNAVKSLKKTQFNIFYVIAFELHYEPIMKAAYDAGLVGDDKVWIFNGFDPSAFQRSLEYPSGSNLANASAGVGFITVSGGVRPEILYPDRVDDRPLQVNPITGFERFRTTWRNAVANNKFVSYARSKISVSLNSFPGYNPDWKFSNEPTGYGPLIYDAVTGVALSYCRALAQYNQTDNFTGPSAYEFFRTLDLDGASGRLKVDAITGTRDYTTLTFTLYNLQPSQASDIDTAKFNVVPINVYTNGNWSTIENRNFIYSGGGTETPRSLPDPDVEENFIGTTGRSIGYTLLGIVVVLSLTALAWLIWFRNQRVVRSSQPLFLLMVCMGAIMMASTIIPLSFEETVTDESGLNAACMVAPWLYLSGSVVALSSLLAKTRGVHQAYTNPELDFIYVSSFDILGTFACLYSLNLIVMIPWTLVAPLEWHRVPRDATDIFDRPVESYGNCSNADALPFAIALLILNISILIMANWWAYQSRNIETEYHESRYIGITMASILQAWCMGIPIMIVVWENPQAKFFVESGIIFVTSLSFLLLVFVPKVFSIRADLIKSADDKKRQAYNTFQTRSRHTSFGNEPEGTRSSDPEGTRIHGIMSEISFPGEECIDTSPATMTADDINTMEKEGEKPSHPGLLEVALESEEAFSRGQQRSRRSSLIRKSTVFSKGIFTVADAPFESEFAIKVIHNPRAKAVLEAGGGQEYSRAQLENLESLRGHKRDAVDDDDDEEEEGKGGMDGRKADVKDEDGVNVEGGEIDNCIAQNASSPSHELDK